MILLESIREGMIEIGQRLDRRRLIAGTDGNISVRLNSDQILITPSGLHKGRLAPDDIVTIDMSGNRIVGRNQPSSESAMHLLVYEKRLEINACVHAHPPYATAFAVAGVPLAEDVLPEVVIFVGNIPLTDYAPPGTKAVPTSLEQYVSNHNAFLLRNHGVLTIGRSLEEAYNRLETVEQYARITYIAGRLGKVNCIPPEDLARLRALRRRFEDDPADLMEREGPCS